jgi:thioredoxin 1
MNAESKHRPPDGQKPISREQVEASKGLTLVDFWAEWCGPCRPSPRCWSSSPRPTTGKVRHHAKMDVDANQRTTMKFNVRSIPALLFFSRDGKHVDTVIGLTQKDRSRGRGSDKHLAA